MPMNGNANEWAMPMAKPMAMPMAMLHETGSSCVESAGRDNDVTYDCPT